MEAEYINFLRLDWGRLGKVKKSASGALEVRSKLRLISD